jgi:predicted DNA-binding protein with PD1-like motif
MASQAFHSVRRLSWKSFLRSLDERGFKRAAAQIRIDQERVKVAGMNFLLRLTKALLIFALCSTWMAIAVRAQEEKITYLSPDESGQKRGSAPGMKVKLISAGEGPKQYAVIFSAGDEAYSGLLEFATTYHVTSGHFTAIGALSNVVLGENPIHEQVEVATMTGDFALYQGKPALHSHIVVGRRDGTASGGHLIEALVSPTLEVFVTVDPLPLQKKYDPSSHLTLIDPDSQ